MPAGQPRLLRLAEHAGRDRLPRPVPLRRGPPRGHFHDSVRVVKPDSAGEPDQIACDLLSLWFIERSEGQVQRWPPAEAVRLARPDARAARGHRQSGRRDRAEQQCHRPRPADRVQPAVKVDHARRRSAGVPATRAQRNPRPQPVLSVGNGGGPPGPARIARARAGSAASCPIGRASSWRPFGATNCGSSRANSIKVISLDRRSGSEVSGRRAAPGEERSSSG